MTYFLIKTKWKQKLFSYSSNRLNPLILMMLKNYDAILKKNMIKSIQITVYEENFYKKKFTYKTSSNFSFSFVKTLNTFV